MRGDRELSTQQPELRLASFNATLQRLRPYLTGDDVGIAGQILAQTLATELLHGMDLLGVTGTQGAGKTTLMREIYGPAVAEWLGDNPGRGERIPVIISEDPDRTITSARLHLLSGPEAQTRMLEVEADVDHRAFREALSGRRQEVVLAELLVPPIVFAGARRGFLLLPGYELVQASNEGFQRRMRRALAACGGFIILTDHTRMAQDAERRILIDLKQHFADGADAAIAISRTEGLTSEKRDELRRTAETLFGLVERPELVIPIGRGSEYLQIWRQPFLDAVQHLGVLTPELRARQLNHLSDEVGRSLGAVLDRAKGMLALQPGPRTTDSSYADALDRFDVSATRLQAEITRELGKSFRSAEERVSAKVDGYVRSEETGWGSVGKGLSEFVHLRKNHRDERIAGKVHEVWLAELEVGLVQQTVNTIEQVSTRDVRQILPIVQAPADSATALARVIDSEGTAIALPEDVKRTLLAISGAAKGVDLPDSRDVAGAYDVLPALVLSYLVLGLRLSPDDLTRMKDGDAPGEQSLHESLKQLAEDNRALVIGLVGLFGLDLAVDGSLDSVPMIAKGLSALLTGGSAPAASLLAPAAGIVGVAAVVGLMHEAVRRGENARAVGGRLSHDHAVALQEQLSVSVDDALARARFVLDRRLQSYFRIDEALAVAQRTYKAIADVEREQRGMKELVNSARVQPF